jgi:hypothetical protein
VAGNKNEPQEIVAHVVVQSFVNIGNDGALAGIQIAAHIGVLAIEHPVAAEVIDGPMLGGSHEPGARIVRDTRLWPLFEGGNQSVLREFFGHPDITHDTREAGDEARGFDPPDGVNCTVSVGSRHSLSIASSIDNSVAILAITGGFIFWR